MAWKRAVGDIPLFRLPLCNVCRQPPAALQVLIENSFATLRDVTLDARQHEESSLDASSNNSMFVEWKSRDTVPLIITWSDDSWSDDSRSDFMERRFTEG